MTNNEKWYLVAFASIVGLGFIIFKKRKTIMETAKNTIWDISSYAKIQTLHPRVREKVVEFINKAEKEGIKLRVTSAFRSYPEQTALYNQGRTTGGSVVTNAKAGESSHNFGTAIDVVEIKDGQALWNGNWEKIAKIGKQIGFSWGGDWKSFKDKPHFEMNFGNTLAQLRSKWDKGQIDDGYVKLT